MNGILIPVLHAFTGICVYAALHHGFIAWRRPAERTHLLFTLLCLLLAVFALVRSAAYQAATAQALVEWQRWGMSSALLFFALFPWFVANYTGVRPRPLLLALSAFSGLILVANLLLPYGALHATPPVLTHFTLPWGERLVDARPPLDATGWFHAAWAILFAELGFLFYAATRQYRRGERRPAAMLTAGAGVFFVVALIGRLAVMGLIAIPPVPEFGFLAMMVIMSLGLTHELHQAERRRHASERRFRSLVEQSPFSIQVLAPDGRTLQVNRAWQRLWGMKLEALADYNILHDRQLAEKGVLSYIERGFAGKPAAIPPIVYNPQDTPEVASGPFRDRWVRAFIYPIKDERHKVREVILMHEDVTAQVRAEQALREIAAGVSSAPGDAFFRGLVTHLARLFDADYAFIGLLDQPQCASVTTLALYARGAIADNMSYALKDTPCANVIGQSTCAYPRGVQQLWPEDRLLAEMGIEGYIGTPLFDAQRRPLGLIVVLSSKPLEQVEQVSDILEIFAARAGAELERTRAERALRDSEERFSKAFRASPDAVSLSRVDDGRFLDVNPGFERISGYARAEVVGRNALELGLWADPAERQRFLTLLQADGAVRDLEMRFRTRQGTEAVCEFSAQVLEIGSERCLLSVGRDITERRRLEEKAREQELQLIQANKMAAMGTLVSSVAHEVNNPNNLVLMNAQVLAEAWADAARILDAWGGERGGFDLGGLPYAEMRETVPRLIHDTYEAALRIQKMVEDLRGFARPAAPGPRTRFEVNEAVRRAVELLHPLIHRKTSRFSLRPAAALPALHGDPLKIEQVVVNLLVNALESLPEPERAVAVSTGMAGDGKGVEICVRDEGCGIPREHLDRVFDAFFTTKLDRGGTGLGLAICHSLVKEHGGRIELDSAPDRGTQARVFLPADPVMEEAAAVAG